MIYFSILFRSRKITKLSQGALSQGALLLKYEGAHGLKNESNER